MDYHFVRNGRSLVAVDAGWQENGHSVYEVQDMDGAVIDTVMVHPFGTIEDILANA